MGYRPRVDLGDLRPLAVVDAHLAHAVLVAKNACEALMVRLKNETNPWKADDAKRQHRKALKLLDATCVAVHRYRTCRATREQTIAAIRAFHDHCAPAGTASLVVGKELVQNPYDPDLLAELPKLMTEAESFHKWLPTQDEETGKSLAEDAAVLEHEFNGALERLRQGEGKRSSVIEAAAKLRERYSVLMAAGHTSGSA